MKQAFEHQQKLWEIYKPTNEKSHIRHVELFKEGHFVTFEGKVSGPYIEHVSRFYSNGEGLDFYNLASLNWAVSVLEIY